MQIPSRNNKERFRNNFSFCLGIFEAGASHFENRTASVALLRADRKRKNDAADDSKIDDKTGSNSGSVPKAPLYGILSLLLSSCSVGPDYVKPSVVLPSAYKEAGKGIGWKVATPHDDCVRGPWWEIFQDSKLNELIQQIDVSNQNLKAIEAQYLQALAVVDGAVAGFFPVITATGSSVRQKNPVSSSTSSTVATSPRPITTDTTSLNGTWAIDVWGAVRRLVESDVAAAEATAAQIGSVRLLAQAALAQFYFQLRSLDEIKTVLDDGVKAYQNLLALTRNRYKAGTISELNVLQAEQNLQNFQVLALDNGIKRGQFEHAIAVLIGQPPSCFSISPRPTTLIAPTIPVEVPSELLERRPDVAQAERTVAQQNALIGVAIAGFFPTLSLTGTVGGRSTSFSNIFNAPNQFWAIGAQVTQLIFDAGLTMAKVEAAGAVHEQSIANYRQTVLTAIQDVEDTMIAARILSAELIVQEKTVATTEKLWRLTINQYKAGTVQFSDVITSLTSVYTAKQNAETIRQQQFTAIIGIIRALGGGWDGCVNADFVKEEIKERS